jgi:hypothetical protein
MAGEPAGGGGTRPDIHLHIVWPGLHLIETFTGFEPLFARADHRVSVRTGGTLDIDNTAIPDLARRASRQDVVAVSPDGQPLTMDEGASRAGESRFRALAAASGGVFYQMSADWSEMQSLDGRGLIASNDAPIRDWLQRNIPESEHAAVRKRIAHCIEHKAVFELDHRVYRPHREIGWVHSRAVPVLDDAGAQPTSATASTLKSNSGVAMTRSTT